MFAKLNVPPAKTGSTVINTSLRIFEAIIFPNMVVATGVPVNVPGVEAMNKNGLRLVSWALNPPKPIV